MTIKIVVEKTEEEAGVNRSEIRIGECYKSGTSGSVWRRVWVSNRPEFFFMSANPESGCVNSMSWATNDLVYPCNSDGKLIEPPGVKMRADAIGIHDHFIDGCDHLQQVLTCPSGAPHTQRADVHTRNLSNGDGNRFDPSTLVTPVTITEVHYRMGD